MTNKLYTIHEAAKKLGVSVDTLRRWERKGKITSERTEGGHRRYSLENIENIKYKRIINKIHPISYVEVPVEKVVKTISSDYINPVTTPSVVFVGNSRFPFRKFLLFLTLASACLLVLFFLGKTGLVGKAISYLPEETRNQIEAVASKFTNSPFTNHQSPVTAAVLAESVSKDLSFDVNINTNLSKNLVVGGDATVNGVLNAASLVTNGNITAQSVTSGPVRGTTGTFTGAVTTGALTTGNVTTNGTLSVSGTSTLTGDVTASGKLTVAGTSKLTGDVTASGALTVSGATTLSGSLAISGNLTKINGVTYSYPTSQGAGSTFLVNDGSGNLTWGTLAGTTGVLPIVNGGTNNSTAYTAGSVIFSNGTKLTQDNSKFFWDDTNFRLGIGTTAPSRSLDVAGAVNLGSATTDLITFTGRVTSGTSLIPAVNLGSDLGSSTNRFNNLYVGTVNSNSTLSTTGQALFTYSPTDTTYGQSSVMINPTTAPVDSNLLGIGIAGAQKAGIDAEGDLTLGYSGIAGSSVPTATNPLAIYNHGTTELMRVQATGEVGIGTTSPTTLTDIEVNNSSTTATNILTVGNAYTGASQTNKLVISVGSNTNRGTYLEDYENGALQSQLLLTIGSIRSSVPFWTSNGTAANPSIAFTNNSNTGLFNSSGILGFTTSGTEKMRIDAAGNVGIGVTNPGALLQVNAATTTNTGAIFKTTDDNFTKNLTEWQTSSGGVAARMLTGLPTAAGPDSSASMFGLTATANGSVVNYATGIGDRIILSGAVTGTSSFFGAHTRVDIQNSSTWQGNGVGSYSEAYLDGTGTSGQATGSQSVVNVGSAGNASTRTLAAALTGSINFYTGAVNLSSTYLAKLGYTGTSAGTVTTAYGIYIDSVTQGSNNYSIYSNGGQSYFAGNVGIGITNPGAPLDVRPITGTTLFRALASNNIDGLVVNSQGQASLTTGCNAVGMTQNCGAVLQIGNAGAVANRPSLVLYNTSSQLSSSPLLEWQNSSASPMGVIDYLGNVGIGVTNPVTALDIFKGSGGYDGTGYRQLRLSNDTASGYQVFSGAVAATEGYFGVNTYYGNGGQYIPTISVAGGMRYVNSRLTFFNDTSLVAGTLYTPSERMTILTSGNVGINTTNPTNRLDISDNSTSTASAMIRNTSTSAGIAGLAIKLSSTTLDNTSRFINFLDLNGTIIGKVQAANTTSVNYAANGTDMAEYFTKDSSIFTPGDLVSQGTNGATLTTSSYDSKMIGIVSTAPSFTGGVEGPNKVLVALVGQVPVKISSSSQPIQAGDYITSSGEAGKAMKAINPGYTIGKALEAWDPPSTSSGFGNTTINVAIHNSYFEGDLSGQIAQLKTDVANLTTDISLLKLSTASATVATDSATFKTLTVTGSTLLSDTVINGKLDVGTMTLDNTDSSINALGILKLQSKILGSVDIMNGKVVIDTTGNVNITSGHVIGNSSFRDTQIIPANSITVYVARTWDSPPSGITANADYDTYVWVTDITKGGFTLHVKSAPTLDSKLFWTAVW